MKLPLHCRVFFLVPQEVQPASSRGGRAPRLCAGTGSGPRRLTGAAWRADQHWGRATVVSGRGPRGQGGTRRTPPHGQTSCECRWCLCSTLSVPPAECCTWAVTLESLTHSCLLSWRRHSLRPAVCPLGGLGAAVPSLSSFSAPLRRTRCWRLLVGHFIGLGGRRHRAEAPKSG